jgi:hypothetical protein
VLVGDADLAEVAQRFGQIARAGQPPWKRVMPVDEVTRWKPSAGESRIAMRPPCGSR